MKLQSLFIFRYFFVGLVFFLSFSQCAEEDSFSSQGIVGADPYENTQNARIDAEITQNKIITSLIGTVTNSNGNAMAGVEVSAGGKTKMTNSDGTFLFEEVEINADFVKVTANKTGYFQAIKTFTPTGSALNSVNLMLVQKNDTKTFSSTAGGNIVFANGIQIQFDANEIVNQETGTPYTGNVTIVSHYYNPTASNFAESMPGNLNGFDASNNFVALDSYGMIAVEMTDEAGNKLNIAKGQKVSIKIPKPTVENAPATIPLWRLNETYGMWVEVGTASLVGDYYVGEVDHFSSYNLDVKFVDPFRLKIQLRDENNKPLKGQKAFVQVEGRVSKLEVITDENGKFELYNADKNLKYIVSIPLTCKTITETFGSYTDLNAEVVNEKLENIADSQAATYTIKGELEACEGYTPAAGDVVLIKLEKDGTNYSFTSKTDAQGKFDISKLVCDVDLTGIHSITVKVYDLNSTASYTQTATVNFIDGTADLTVNNCEEKVTSESFPDDFPIPFEDENFEQCVKSKLDMTSNDVITYGDVKNMTQLICDNNGIENIKGIGLFTKLTDLQITKNKITNIPVEISNLTNLQKLNLNYNLLTSIPSTIGSLSRLEILNCGSNRLTSIPSEIGNLANLQILDLSSNGFTTVPSFIGNLINLEYLDFSGNLLTSLPTTIGNLIKLKSIGLHENQLTSLPIEIGNLTKLQGLSLTQNKLINLPSTIGNLINLEQLILTYNKLTTLPSTIGNLTNLKYLNIDHNQLTILPSEIGNLVNLQELYLVNSPLTSIPPTIGNLTNLKTLFLINNQLTVLPPSIVNLTKLQRISFFGNLNLIGSVKELGLCDVPDIYISKTQLTNDCP